MVGGLAIVAGVILESLYLGEWESGYVYNPIAGFRTIFNSSDWTTKVVTEGNFVMTRWPGNLPALSWVTPPAAIDPSTDKRPAWERKLVRYTDTRHNAGAGDHGTARLIVVVWDDFGGFSITFRIPSAINMDCDPSAHLHNQSVAGQGVYHTQVAFASVLRFMEEKRSGAESGGRRTRAANDMQDAFNYSQTPWRVGLNQRTVSRNHGKVGFRS